MSSPQKYAQFKDLSRGDARKQMVKDYLKSHKGLRNRVAARAGVDVTMVTKVLQGAATSAPVVGAIEAEERRKPDRVKVAA